MKSVGGIVLGGVIALAGIGIIIASCKKDEPCYRLGYDGGGYDDLELGAESCEVEESGISENAKETLASL